MIGPKPKYMDNKDYWTYDENQVVILTDDAPIEAIIEYNEVNAFSLNYLGVDYTINPQKFFEMRKRINYPEKDILTEMKMIFTVKQIAAWNKTKKQ